jgi:hypothetical protein
LSASIRETEYAFAEEEPGRINGAILKVPAESPLAASASQRSVASGTATAYGAVGPRLLTELVEELELGAHAWPTRALYPIGWREALSVLDPAKRDAVEELTRESSFIHLWSEMLWLHNVLKTVRPPAGSYLAEMYDRHGVEFPAGPRYEFAQLRPQIWLHERHLAMREELTRLHEELATKDPSP